MGFNSKYKGSEVEVMLDTVNEITPTIEDLINKKAGAFYMENTTGLFIAFNTEEAKTAYLSSGDESGVIGKFAIWAGMSSETVYSMQVTGLSELYNFTTSSDKMEISAGFLSQVKHNDEEGFIEFNESAIFSVTVIKQGAVSGTVVSGGNIIPKGGTFTFDVKPYVGNGDNTIIISAEGLVSSTKGVATATVAVTSMSLSPMDFKWYTPFIEGQEMRLGGLMILGSLNKTLHVRVSGNGYEKTYAEPLGTYQVDSVAYTFDKLEHPSVTGVYQVEMWLEADDSGLLSDVLTYNMMFIASEDVHTAQIICMNNVAEEAQNYAENTLFTYAAYNKGNTTASPVITLAVDGETLFSNTYEVTASALNTFIYSFAISSNISQSEIAVTAVFGNTQSAVITLLNETSFAPVAGYSFYMESATRYNADENRESLVNEASSGSIAATWTDMAWVDGMDGWTVDEDGVKCLIIPAMSKAEVELTPMKNISTLTLEMLYKVKNVSDFNEDIITIVKDTASSWMGVKIKPTNVTLHSQSLFTDDLRQGYNTKDEEMVHLVVTIVNNYSGIGNIAMIYVNGVKKCSFEWANGDTFAHDGKLLLGSNTADLYFYKMRMYNNAFSWPQVMQNYLSCISDPAEKSRTKRREDSVLNDANGLDYDKIYGKFNTFVVELPKGAVLPNKLTNPSNEAIEGSNLYINIVQNPSCSIQGEWLDIPVEGQGTTAMTYYRWNLRSKTSSAYDKFRITAKKNVASSMHSHKMGGTSLYNDLNRAVVGANEADGRVAVYQYPVYGFQKIEKEDIPGTYYYEFIGLYTIGPDKGDKSTFGYDNADYESTLIHMEGTDHSPRGVGMDYPWAEMTVGLNADGDAFIGPKNTLGELAEEAWEIGTCGEYEDVVEMKSYIDTEFAPAYELDYHCTPLIAGLPSDITIADVNANVNAFRALETDNGFSYGDCIIFDSAYDTYYFNVNTLTYVQDGFKVYEGLDNYGFTLAELESKATLEEKIGYLRECRKARYCAEMGNYWHLNDNLFHACFLDLIGATDNEKKNSYPYKFGTLESGSRWRWRQDDLDTVLDVNNQGSADKKYSILNTDKMGGTMIFKGNTSYHWRCVREYYADEYKGMMQTIMSTMVSLCPAAYGSSKIQKLVGCIRKYFWDNAQEYFTGGAYNIDGKWTYEDAWAIYKSNSNVNAVHPLQQSLGSHYEAEVAWVTLRMLFLASLNEFGSFVDYVDTSEGQVSFRQGGDFTFTLTPAIDMRPSVIQGANSRKIHADGRIFAGNTAEISTNADTSADTMVYIQGADWLTNIGDFSKAQIGSSSQEFAVTSKRLQTLKIGDEVAENVTTNINGLNVGACPSLVEIEARNVSGINKDIDLSGCPRLRRAYFGGTAATAITLPDGCKVEEFDLPSSLVRLKLVKLPLITTDGLTYENMNALAYLWVEGNRNIDGYGLLKSAYDNNSPLTNIRVIGFTREGSADDVAFLAALANGNYHGIDADGSNNNAILPVLEGTINIDGYMYQDEADVVLANFPQIVLNALGFYLKFADPEVLSVLLANMTTDDGIGITVEQAEALKDIGYWFRYNSSIKSFDELARFTGLTSLQVTAFRECTALESVGIPPQITELPTNSFYGCSSLKEVKAETPIKILRDGTFCGCSSLEVFDASELEILDCVGIGTGVFVNSGLKEFNAPKLQSISTTQYCAHFMGTPIERVLSLGNITMIPSGNSNYGVFKGCTSLMEVNLPDTLEEIGAYAFYGCTSLEFEELNLPNLTSLGQNAFYGVQIKKLVLGALTTLPTATASTQNFGDKSVLEEVVLSGEVTTIPKYSFQGYSVRNIAGLDNVSTIELQAFNGCSSLETELNMPNLESIGDIAFKGCAIERITNLGKITSIAESSNYNGTFAQCKNLSFARMPSTLTTIGRFTFYNCSSLKTLIMESETPPTMSDTRTLTGTHADFAIYVPAASMSDYAAATNWSGYASRLAPLEDHEDGGYVPFADSAVEAICVANWDTNGSGYMSKNECAAVTSVGTKFKGNTEITSFEELKDFTNVTAIAQDAFYNCTALVSIGSENITSFGKYSFYGCSALEFVDFSSCTSIGESAFQYCPLSGELVLINVTNLGNNTFSNSNFTRIILPNIVTINQNVWQNNTMVEYLELGENITTIGGYSFYRSAALSTIICRATTPPTLGDGNYFTNATIYVPDESVDTYKTATNWSQFSDRIKPLSEYVEE